MNSFNRADTASSEENKRDFDKHGFQSEEMSLQDAFTLKPIKFGKE